MDALTSALQNIYREDDLVIDVAASKNAIRIVPKNYGLFAWIGDYWVIYFVITLMLLFFPLAIVAGIKADFGFGPVLKIMTAVFIISWIAAIASTTRQVLKRNLLIVIPGNADKRKNAENALLVVKAREWSVVKDTPDYLVARTLRTLTSYGEVITVIFDSGKVYFNSNSRRYNGVKDPYAGKIHHHNLELFTASFKGYQRQ